jgi:uncharacterized membrane protein YdjX (TVP38/TMEM64 family)
MKKHFKLLGLVAVFIVAIAVYTFTPVKQYLTEEALRAFLTPFGMYAPLAYGVLYFVLILFLLPASVFTVLAGLLFGKLVGTTVVVIAATAAACSAFILSRYFGEGAAKKLVRSPSLGKWVKKIEKQCAMNGFQFFFIMRCLFLPYMLVSYACGLVECAKLRDFVTATFLTNVIFSFMFVYLGDSLFKGPKALILPVIMVVLALQVPRVIKKYKKDVM